MTPDPHPTTPHPLALPPQTLPALITQAGAHAERRFLEFFAAHIRNPHTRRAYLRSAIQFLDWCEDHGLQLARLDPLVVATYIERLTQTRSAPTVKQHLAALRMLFDFLVVGQVVTVNPAASVRGPKHVVRTGKTPVLFEDEARRLLEAIETDTIGGLRDRALIAVMVYSFARVGAVVKMKVKDYVVQSRRAWFILHEKGGKFHRVPAHHQAADHLEAYLEQAGIAGEREGALFRSLGGRGRALSDRFLDENDVLRMIKRRARAAGLPEALCCHTFRATGITNYLQNGGSLEIAARIAAHESTRTTQLYNRTDEEVALGEIERIRI